jgi:cytochrome c oxidase subunit 1
MNQTATLGGVVLGLGVLLLVLNVFASRRSTRAAPENPWNAATLEWATASPPPSYNFHPLPAVASRDPLWLDPPHQPVVIGVQSDVRQVLVTRLLDGEPDHLYKSPEPSIWPFWAAVATSVMFIGSIFTPWAVVWGSIPIAVTLVLWFWPKRREQQEENEERQRQPELPRTRFTTESAA